VLVDVRLVICLVHGDEAKNVAGVVHRERAKGLEQLELALELARHLVFIAPVTLDWGLPDGAGLVEPADSFIL
jgi:hypothetical protein